MHSIVTKPETKVHKDVTCWCIFCNDNSTQISKHYRPNNNALFGK